MNNNIKLAIYFSGLSAVAGGLVGGLLVNGHWYKGTSAFLDKRAKDDKREAAKHIGEVWGFMSIISIMNKKIQDSDASEEVKQQLQHLRDLALVPMNDQTKLDMYHKALEEFDLDDFTAA